jgi:hypothetical protein
MTETTRTMQLYHMKYGGKRKAGTHGRVHGYIGGFHGDQKRFLCGRQWKPAYKSVVPTNPETPEDDVTCTRCLKILVTQFPLTDRRHAERPTNIIPAPMNIAANVAEEITRAVLQELREKMTVEFNIDLDDFHDRLVADLANVVDVRKLEHSLLEEITRNRAVLGGVVGGRGSSR